ncbi:hypothetical protein MW887_011920 [Aspergillus wentii]|nr:hypothetical protein MW887_011920 [Aspergillus wentii]
MERMNNSIQTLFDQSGTGIPRQDSEATTHGPERFDTTTTASSNLNFDASRCPNPPLETLSHFVEIYKAKLHLQPLPLFDMDGLSAQVSRFPQFLLRSFLAVTLLFSGHPFYGTSKADAIEFYVRSSRETTISLAAECTPSLEVIQSLCLLTLSDISAGKQARARMNIGMASVIINLHSKHLEGLKTTSMSVDDKARCCWSVFILERAFTPGPNTLQPGHSPLVHINYPPSHPRPSDSAHTDVSSIPYLTSGNATNDLGVNAYCLQLISIWGEIAAYLHQARLGKVEEPWLASSTYHKLAANFYEFESSLAQVHRFKNVGFQTRSYEEIARDKSYWSPWLVLQITFHAGQALLHHPIFHIATFRKNNTVFQPPTFLQHTIDQALLHSGWIARFISMCENLGYEICDPFLGRLVVVVATIHWIFSLASDETVTERARSDFNHCQRFIIGLANKWPQFSQLANGLENLQSPTRQANGTTSHNGISSFKISLLWELLDTNSTVARLDMSPQSFAPVEQRISTQYLAPLRESPSYRDAGRFGHSTGIPASEFPASPLPGFLMSDDFLSHVDIPELSQLDFRPSLNFHGGL